MMLKIDEFMNKIFLGGLCAISCIFLACSDEDKATQIDYKINISIEGTNIPSPEDFTSLKYMVWNETQNQLLPVSTTSDGVGDLDFGLLNGNSFQLGLYSDSDYRFYVMGVADVKEPAAAVDRAVCSTRSDVSLDPRKNVWMEDVDGSLMYKDLFWGSVLVNTNKAGSLTLERVIGQVNFNVSDKNELIKIDSLYLSVPDNQLSKAILNDGTLVQGTAETVSFWKIDTLFNMLPMNEPAVNAELHLFVTNHYGDVKESIISLEDFQVKANQCLHVDFTDILWNEDGTLASSVKPVITWGKTIEYKFNTGALDNIMTPAAEINKNADMYYYYNQLTEAQKRVYEAICRNIVAFDDEGSPLPRIYINTPFESEKADITAASNAVNRDMPSFFHHKYTTAYYSYKDWLMTSITMPYSQYLMKYDLARKGADEILSRMPEGMSEYERAKWIWDEFLKSVSYGMLSGSEGDLYGAFVYHKIVCEGYARGYQYLCQRAGLQVLYVDGIYYDDSGAGISHAWNIVRIDGMYYYADPTWDDGMSVGSTVVRYDHFLKSASTFGTNHVNNKAYEYPEISTEDYPLNL